MPLATPVKSMGNVVVLYNSVDITAACNQAQLQAMLDEMETTNLASTAVEVKPGPAKWTISLSGFWSKELDDAAAPDVIAPVDAGRACQITVGPAGSSTKVRYAWAAGCYITGWTINAAGPTQYINHDMALNMSGNPTRTIV